MIRLLFLLLLVACGCGSESQETLNPFDDAKAERDRRVTEFDQNQIPRCDRVTFVSLFDALGRQINLFDYEKPLGKWNRDLEPCYETDLDGDGEYDSKSQTSRDGYLGVLHALISRGDRAAAGRVVDYARPLDWVAGDGPESVTSIWPLGGLFEELAGLESLTEDESEDAIAFFSGFRGHLIATYLWAKLRLSGSLNAAEIEVLHGLHVNDRGNPYFAALYHRLSDGDQQETLDLLRAYPRAVASYGWGSEPDDLAYILCIAILEGR